MKKIAINIFVDGVNYTSLLSEYNLIQENQLKELLQKAAEGKLTYMKFESSNKLLFFPADIIKQSILSLVYSN